MEKEDTEGKRFRGALSQTGRDFCENTTMDGFAYWVNSGMGEKTSLCESLSLSILLRRIHQTVCVAEDLLGVHNSLQPGLLPHCVGGHIHELDGRAFR